jgi:DNA-binding SARP family transcriptional activator
MEFRILGPVGLWSDGVELQLRGSKQRTMLAALLLARQRVLSDSQLGEMLWGKKVPKTYQAQIYTYVSRLRQHLPDGIQVVRQGPGYFLRIGPALFDYREFERLSRAGRNALRRASYDEAAELLRAALSLWRGPTLTDVTELLAEVERPRIEEDRMEALECRIEAELTLGRHDQLLSELVGLVGAHPLRERIRALMMVALYRSDRRGEAFATYREGCQLLAEELGVDPGPTLRAAYQALLTEDIGRIGPHPAGQSITVAGQPARPAMLDPDIPDFVARAEQLETITSALRTDPATVTPRHPVTVVSGMCGVGKTTLALHAANLCRDEFPDGQLFADLRGSTGRPLPPAEALAKMLGAFGFAAETLPAELDQRVHLYRGILANRRVLVVLDDAASEEQVRPLLVGEPRCRVLVTTRYPLTTLSGQHTVHVVPFDAREGMTMLTQIVGAVRAAAEPAAAERIVDSCAGLPLAIRIAGTRLDMKRHWSFARLTGQLDGESRLNTLRLGHLDVRDRVARGIRILDRQARTALLRLALPAFRHSVTSAVLGVSDAVGEQITEHLLDLHLLDHAGVDETGSHMYRFHDLVLLVARELAAQEEVNLGPCGSERCGDEMSVSIA